MGCASAKHVSTVQNEEETQKGKNYQNGDVFGDEYRIKPVEEVKYMKNGGEDDQKIAARNQENLEKSASSNVRLKSNKEIPGLVHQPRANMHISESQQEFFRMLDEKIEKVRCDKVNALSNKVNTLREQTHWFPSSLGRTASHCMLQRSTFSTAWRGCGPRSPLPRSVIR
uniref:Chromosome 1 open reading frame 21 n=12 Tax=Neoaves TaxID=3078114 RepID=A0A8C4U2C0_FALTI